MKTIMVPVNDLLTGLFQPEGRTRNTTDIQTWLQADPDGLSKHPLQISKDNHILDGHRRYTAARALGLKEVPCIVVCEYGNSLEALQYSISPTLSREDTPRQKLYRLKAAERQLNMRFEDVVRKLGYPMNQAQNLLVLDKLPADLQESVETYYLSDGRRGTSLSAAVAAVKSGCVAEVNERVASGKRVTRGQVEIIEKRKNAAATIPEINARTVQNTAERALRDVLELADRNVLLGLKPLCEAILAATEGT